MACARVCVRTVSKGIRFFPSVAPPDRHLGDARAAIDRGDGLAAVKSLDLARRGYVKHRDTEGLAVVLDMAALVDAGGNDRVRIAHDNLVYAVKQNLRQESRRTARERGEPWVDPFPDLQAPTEHTGLVLTRGAKIAIAIGVLAGTALVAAVVASPWLGGSNRAPKVTLRLLNDTPETVTLRGCDDPDCTTTWLDRRLGPGLEADSDVPSDELVAVFRVERPSGEACLPVRVHDGYQRLDGSGALAVRLSLATPCPGTTVQPVPAGSAPL